MKARDIIPGWPKPRSTSAFNVSRADFRWGIWMGWSATSLAYLEQNVEYHEGQQRMIDEYFEKWRTPQTPVIFNYRGLGCLL